MSDFRGWAFAIGLAAAALLTGSVFSGCEKNLATGEFVGRYEKECAVSVDRDGFRFVVLYESPEYLAALSGGDAMKAKELDSLRTDFGKANYVRISIRPTAVSHGGVGSITAIEDQEAVLGERLRQVQGEMGLLMHLRGPDGDTVAPIAVTFQGGTHTGAANTVTAVFPKESRGAPIELKKWELMIDDFGLNLGTVRARLAMPKGFRLKVAA
jgi:hypothetical protein